MHRAKTPNTQTAFWFVYLLVPNAFTFLKLCAFFFFSKHLKNILLAIVIQHKDQELQAFLEYLS